MKPNRLLYLFLIIPNTFISCNNKIEMYNFFLENGASKEDAIMAIWELCTVYVVTSFTILSRVDYGRPAVEFNSKLFDL